MAQKRGPALWHPTDPYAPLLPHTDVSLPPRPPQRLSPRREALARRPALWEMALTRMFEPLRVPERLRGHAD